MAFKYKLKEQDKNEKVKEFHNKRIKSFDEIEAQLKGLEPLLKRAKIDTIKHYRENPDSLSVVYGTDMINDYIKDIKTLLKKEE